MTEPRRGREDLHRGTEPKAYYHRSAETIRVTRRHPVGHYDDGRLEMIVRVEARRSTAGSFETSEFGEE